MAVLVDLVRSGGFAGVSLRSSVSETELSPADVDALFELVRRFEGGRSLADRGRATPDRFQYDVTVYDRGQERRATMWEDDLRPNDRDLLTRLIQRRDR
jgi:hypothetical protein